MNRKRLFFTIFNAALLPYFVYRVPYLVLVTLSEGPLMLFGLAGWVFVGSFVAFGFIRNLRKLEEV